MNTHFASLVMGLAAQAEAAMAGQLPPGMDALPEAQLRQLAQSLIDTLGMLEEKTRGNLSPEEGKLLADALTAVRFRFVQTGGPRH